MLALLLSLFRLVWLFGKGHRDVVPGKSCITSAALHLPTPAEASTVERGRQLVLDDGLGDVEELAASSAHGPSRPGGAGAAGAFSRHWGGLSRKPGRIGRPPIKREIHRLIQTLAKANPLWRAPRIHGEWKKLEITASEQTVSRVLRSIHALAFEAYSQPSDKQNSFLQRDSRHTGPGRV